MSDEQRYPYPYAYPYFQQPYPPPGSQNPHPGPVYPAAPGMGGGFPGPPGYGVGHETTHLHAAQSAHPHYATQQNTPFFNVGNERFLRGLLMGAAATYILTNEKVQRSTIKGMVRVWSTLQGGVEELKERFQDAEAELRATEDEDES
jgi:hypothetical protein